MPLGPFGQVLGTTGTLDLLDPDARNYESHVVAPRNPKLLREDPPPFKMTPSQYMFQMSLTTEKKLANTHNMQLPKKLNLLDMGETTHQRFSQVDIEEPIFQPYPSELVFVNYEPNIAHELPLLLRNNDKVPRLVKVVQADSPYFKIISPNNVGEKCAPGLALTFLIQFIPDEKKDYTHELMCITEREKFVVPVRCVGARAILDFPDSVNFDTCPVKYKTERSLLTSEPHQGDLEIEYDTGERIYMSLTGVGQDVNVRLDKSAIRIESTYVGLANQRAVTIVNRSDAMASFRFTKFATALEEEMEREMLERLSDIDRQAEMKRFAEELGADPTVKDKMAIINRSFLSRRKQIEDNELVFEDDVL
uniref:MSP domain-containing protein n=1 Tax=Macrostomum lignano TaxID=282301 RepID=A0A1I8IBX3_9PLAT